MGRLLEPRTDATPSKQTAQELVPATPADYAGIYIYISIYLYIWSGHQPPDIYLNTTMQALDCIPHNMSLTPLRVFDRDASRSVEKTRRVYQMAMSIRRGTWMSLFEVGIPFGSPLNVCRGNRSGCQKRMLHLPEINLRQRCQTPMSPNL